VTDRELLELAAKAAGILPLPDGKELDAAPDGGLMICGGGEVKYWNPLTDDGVALRLAVKLRLTIMQLSSNEEVLVSSYSGSIEAYEFHLSDPCAATRRAIVRAAAEIGMGMSQPSSRTNLPEDNYYKTQAEAEEIGKNMP
jgi:hypothetical protein